MRMTKIYSWRAKSATARVLNCGIKQLMLECSKMDKSKFMICLRATPSCILTRAAALIHATFRHGIRVSRFHAPPLQFAESISTYRLSYEQEYFSTPSTFVCRTILRMCSFYCNSCSCTLFIGQVLCVGCQF